MNEFIDTLIVAFVLLSIISVVVMFGLISDSYKFIFNMENKIKNLKKDLNEHQQKLNDLQQNLLEEKIKKIK
jgi:cell division protein FtsL